MDFPFLTNSPKHPLHPLWPKSAKHDKTEGGGGGEFLPLRSEFCKKHFSSKKVRKDKKKGISCYVFIVVKDTVNKEALR